MRLLRKTCLISLAAAVSIAIVPAAAMATSAPTRAAAIHVQLWEGTFALDGLDYYWFTDRQSSRGCASTARLWRRSVLGGKPRLLATYRLSCYRSVGGLVAGGGRVAFDQSWERPNSLKSEIVSMDRNGGSRKVLARSNLKTFSTGLKNDLGCGSASYLMSATPTGGFVVGFYALQRKAKRCGGAVDRDDWKYEEVASDGSRRTLIAETTPIREIRDWRPPFADVQVNGDKAVFVRSKSLRVITRDLATGAMAGPFIDSVTLAKGKLKFSKASLAPNGALLVQSYGPIPKKPNSDGWTDLYANSANPSSAVRAPSFYSTAFCGDRLFATRLNEDWDNFPETDAFLSELDPATLMPVRWIAWTRPDESILGCTDTHIVLSGESDDGYALHAVALSE